MRTLVLGGARSGKSEWAENLVHQVAGGARPVVYVATARPWGDGFDADFTARIAAHRNRRPAWWRTEDQRDLTEVLAGLVSAVAADQALGDAGIAPAPASAVPTHQAVRGADIAPALTSTGNTDERSSTGRGVTDNTADASPIYLIDDLGTWLTHTMGESGLWASDLTPDQHSEAEKKVQEKCRRCVESLKSIPPTAEIILVSPEVGMGVIPAHPAGRQFRDALGRLNADVAAACDRVVLVVAGLSLELKAAR